MTTPRAMRRAASRRAAQALNSARGCRCTPTLSYGRVEGLPRVAIHHRNGCPAAPAGGFVRDIVTVPKPGCGR
jgi:hypothetical protein